jgi:Mn2+/Fe2+ NRAMP family transporter
LATVVGTRVTTASAWWKLIGPALLFSGAAIGTSHLVQSTRAGAMYGLALVGVIVAANVLKYPGFRFGVDYGHATGRSIMAGYRELGLWAPLLFSLTTFILPFIHAALAAATAGIVIAVFGTALSVPLTGTLLLGVASLILLGGGYDWLDKVNRVLLVFLVASTLATTVMVLPRVEWGTIVDTEWALDPKAILFVIALAGFMPNPLDVSVTQSMWTAQAKERLQPGSPSTVADSRRAFLVGYVMTAFLAVCFCIMGAGVMHGDGIVPQTSAPGFAAQIIALYSAALGDGAAVLAAIAALSVMLTTLLAALDIGSRNIATTWKEALRRPDEQVFQRTYRICVPVLAGSAGLVLFAMVRDLTTILDLATSAAFISAPAIATVNHLVVTRCAMAEDARPGVAVQTLNIVGVIIMTSLAVAYFVL